MEEQEIWKTLDSDQNYEVSNMGRVRSKRGNVLKQELCIGGYPRVSLSLGKKKRVHRLVAETFVEGYQDGLIVNHKNAIKTDNRASNLEWCTHKQNMQHAFHSPDVPKIRTPAKPVISTCLVTGEETYYESAKAALKDGFYAYAIGAVCLGKKEKYRGRTWRFANAP